MAVGLFGRRGTHVQSHAREVQRLAREAVLILLPSMVDVVVVGLPRQAKLVIHKVVQVRLQLV